MFAEEMRQLLRCPQLHKANHSTGTYVEVDADKINPNLTQDINAFKVMVVHLCRGMKDLLRSTITSGDLFSL
jgi:hypothetical protein